MTNYVYLWKGQLETGKGGAEDGERFTFHTYPLHCLNILTM